MDYIEPHFLFLIFFLQVNLLYHYRKVYPFLYIFSLFPPFSFFITLKGENNNCLHRGTLVNNKTIILSFIGVPSATNPTLFFSLFLLLTESTVQKLLHGSPLLLFPAFSCHELLPISWPAKSPPRNDAAAPTSSAPPPPPIDVISADRPPAGLPPAAIPSPRKSSVVCLGPNTEEEELPIMSSFKPAPSSQGSPSPRPAATRSGSICCTEGDEEDETNPNPRSKDAFVAAAPIWAAFCRSAVADMAGWGGDAYCRRSCPAVPKMEEAVAVERQRETGSTEEGCWRSVEWSERDMALIKSEKAGVWWGCRLVEVFEEAKRLANTLLVVLPLLLELLLLPLQFPFMHGFAVPASSRIGVGSSGNSVAKTKRKGEEKERLLFVKN